MQPSSATQTTPTASKKRPSSTLAGYWKAGLAVIASAGAVAAIFLFPPAAVVLAPAVELLAGALSFAGVYAGLAAFATTLAAVAIATFGAAYLVLAGVSGILNRIFGGKAVDSSAAMHKKNDDKIVADEASSSRSPSEPKNTGSLFSEAPAVNLVTNEAAAACP